jgi:hypothetical protein
MCSRGEESLPHDESAAQPVIYVVAKVCHSITTTIGVRIYVLGGENCHAVNQLIVPPPPHQQDSCSFQ